MEAAAKVISAVSGIFGNITAILSPLTKNGMT
jgi:hypothetical protein